jgi:hypothetical protein
MQLTPETDIVTSQFPAIQNIRKQVVRKQLYFCKFHLENMYSTVSYDITWKLWNLQLLWRKTIPPSTCTAPRTHSPVDLCRPMRRKSGIKHFISVVYIFYPKKCKRCLDQTAKGGSVARSRSRIIFIRTRTASGYGAN